MRENFLHYLWQHKVFDSSTLKTANGETIDLIKLGSHNRNSGPDFFNAQLRINEQLWAGNVEIHIKSSDWYLHHHETDKNYENVILHVVWEYDAPVFRRDNSEIPTLVLKNYVASETLSNYSKLFNAQQNWINCEQDFEWVEDLTLKLWLERLYFERLERKSETIAELLKQNQNNWEAVLFKLMAKNFGLKVNAEAFLSLANSFHFSVLRKIQKSLSSIEALFFGQAQLLSEGIQDNYYLELQQEYKILVQKFQLTNQGIIPLQFFRLRPANFPTLRLAQLAQLYQSQQSLFSKIMSTSSLNEIYAIFNVSTSVYWSQHHSFAKASRASKKRLTKAFIDLLIINTIIPLKFSFAKHQGQSKVEAIIALVQQMPSEKNNIVSRFHSLKPIAITALESQALIQLKTEYCDKNKCLDCAVGNALLKRSV